MKSKWNIEHYEGNPIILENHDVSKVLGTIDEFLIDGKKYMLSPGWINHQDGTKELIELSIIRKDPGSDECKMKRIDNGNIQCECGKIYENPVIYCRDGCLKKSYPPPGLI